MGLFSSEAEAKRKQNLKELEDKRLRFVEILRAEGFAPDSCLFAQKDGGFAAVAHCGGDFFLLTGPAPGAEEEFTLRRVSGARARVEEILIKSEGLGGVLGFGKKGGMGFKMIVDADDVEPFEIEIISGLGTYLEVLPGGKLALLNPKRRRGNANFVWDFQPVERERVAQIQKRWLELINGGAE